MRVIQEPSIPRRGPWLVQRRCPTEHGGCSAVLEISYDDLIFGDHRSSKANVVCPVCGFAQVVHVPFWATQQATNGLASEGVSGLTINHLDQIVRRYLAHRYDCASQETGKRCDCGLQKLLDDLNQVFGKLIVPVYAKEPSQTKEGGK